ncbi:unnamed protein product, partial [Rotaria sp. Silwood2]
HRRNELLLLPLTSEEILSNSPQGNKDLIESDIPTLQMKFHYNELITFSLY